MTMDKLIALREEAGISQNALAGKIGKSHSYVWAVEHGRQRLTSRETIAAWADAIGVHVDVVYRAIGVVPHDIIEKLQLSDVEVWHEVRQRLAEMTEQKKTHR